MTMIDSLNHDSEHRALPGRDRAQRLWRDVGRPLMILMIAIWCIRLMMADWRDVSTASMQPAIQPGDRILVNKLAYGFSLPMLDEPVRQWSQPTYGDVIVFRMSDGPQTMVKRIIAVPGDVVEMKGHRVWINHEEAIYSGQSPVPVSDTADHTARPIATTEAIGLVPHTILVGDPRRADVGGQRMVPPNHYFVLGDNRNDSWDSRSMGFIHRDQIMGKVYAVAFSLDLDRPGAMRSERLFKSVF